MQERTRILELVKKGIISSEEAIVLLENLAQDKDKEQIQKAAKEVHEEKELSNEKTTEEQAEEEETLNDLKAQLQEVEADLAKTNKLIQSKKAEKQILDTTEELEILKEGKGLEAERLFVEIKELEAQAAELLEAKTELLTEIKAIQKERFSQKFEIPEDWKDQTQETLSDMGSKVYEASNQIGSFLKKTFTGFAEAVNENVDWKDVNIKVPGIASTKFQHTFDYPEVKASLIDVKLANGEVEFRSHDGENVKVEAQIKLYGKTENKTPLEAFLEKSQIDVDDEMISFQIPDKRIKADLIFYLPQRQYDHMAVRLLNGNVEIHDLKGQDIYVKNTNGNIEFNKVEATMLEISNVNGNILVEDVFLRDLSCESVNGNITGRNLKVKSIASSVVNGEIRLTLQSEELANVTASSVHGDIKIALPKALSLTGTFETMFGSIKHRLTNVEVTKERAGNYRRDGQSNYIELQRLGEGSGVAAIKGSTSSGRIYLKDTDEA